MKRREFIKKAALTGALSVSVPYILPTGRLFAASGSRKVNHVVFCLFAGGVRNIEAMQKADGNLMPFTLNGNETISPDIAAGMSLLPTPTGPRLQSFGTLYKEFRYLQGPTGHFNGHTTAITGNYTNNNVQLRQPPKWPTVFELYRKHTSANTSALNAWWVTNSLGPYPYLNYSIYDGYGPEYGANMMQPSYLFRYGHESVLENPQFYSDVQLDKVDMVKEFLDSQFSGSKNAITNSITNTEEEREQLEAFYFKMIDGVDQGSFTDPYGIGSANSSDIYNMFFASKVLEEFEPELLVVNMQGIDVCHTNFTSYCNNIRRSDFALKKLWDSIQSIPGMKDDTLLIAIPEHGRNLEPNTIRDPYGRFAIDHTGDEMSRSIFCLVLGPNGVVVQGQEINNVKGESVDVVATIANALGFDSDLPSGLLGGRLLEDAFV